MNRELLRAYDDKSNWDVLLQREPLPGLSKVKTENLLQEKDDRAYEQLREVNVDAAAR